MKYVALLRGINVGGHNKVSMAELRKVFATAGMTEVSTYINSGNVIFRSDSRSAVKLADQLEQAIEAAFGFAVRVLVRDQASITALVKALPDSWVNNTALKCDVMFLWKSVDSPDIMRQLPIRSGIDRVRYEPGALLWSFDRANASKSGIARLVGTDLYRQMTLRNSNTLRKLAVLMQ